MLKIEVTIPDSLAEDFLSDRLNRCLQILAPTYNDLPKVLRKMFKEAKIVEQTPSVPCTLDKEGIFEICDDNINAHYHSVAFEKVKILINLWGDDFHKYLLDSLRRCVPNPIDVYEDVRRELGFKLTEIDGKRYFVQQDGKGNVIWKQEHP